MSSSNFKVTQGGDEQATKTAHVMWPRVSKIAPAMWHWNDFMRMLFPAWLMILAAGCSINGTPFSGDNAVSLADNNRVSPPLISQNNSARIRLSLFTDARVFDNPRKLGTGAEYVSGLSGKDILLDQEVAMAVANLMKQRLYDAGFPVRDAVGDAQFELNGVVKELTYNVKARDEITIAIQATLLDANSGKIIWSGLVTERNDRFACVAGNNKNDVANYLRKELAIVTAKITDAISASLVATHPELFKPIPGAQPVPGVTVLVAPPVTESPVTPTYWPDRSLADANKGLLLIKTTPPRATVYLDDVYYGLTPVRAELATGIYRVMVKLEGYKTATEKVSVRKEDHTELELVLHP